MNHQISIWTTYIIHVYIYTYNVYKYYTIATTYSEINILSGKEKLGNMGNPWTKWCLRWQIMEPSLISGGYLRISPSQTTSKSIYTTYQIYRIYNTDNVLRYILVITIICDEILDESTRLQSTVGGSHPLYSQNKGIMMIFIIINIMYVNMYLYVCICICIYIYICPSIYLNIYIYMYIYIYKSMNICIRILICIYIYNHWTYIYIYVSFNV